MVEALVRVPRAHIVHGVVKDRQHVRAAVLRAPCSVRGEGHGDTVLVAGHEVGVTEVSARVLPALVLGAVVAVPVTCLTTS